MGNANANILGEACNLTYVTALLGWIRINGCHNLPIGPLHKQTRYGGANKTQANLRHFHDDTPCKPS